MAYRTRHCVTPAWAYAGSMSIDGSRILSATSRAEEVFNDFQREILSEKAATLSRAAKKLEAALAALGRAGEEEGSRAARVQEAADAAYGYLVQREACGVFGLGAPLDAFDVPREVRVRIGVSAR
ncbi:DUF6665 family protein [Sphingomonas sp.]|uniref:DUF6665 family protein n=1 Tax=Sphingomonas sp. TaxID=28214 RepID=UPI001EB7BEAB|nr:DUF6665 family protein [Sphingomonas sp.]MBX3594070.1 hypothetical protein [Sphingomonas sp.]